MVWTLCLYRFSAGFGQLCKLGSLSFANEHLHCTIDTPLQTKQAWEPKEEPSIVPTRVLMGAKTRECLRYLLITWNWSIIRWLFTLTSMFLSSTFPFRVLTAGTTDWHCSSRLPWNSLTHLLYFTFPLWHRELHPQFAFLQSLLLLMHLLCSYTLYSLPTH
jgi:hypothetical protein